MFGLVLIWFPFWTPKKLKKQLGNDDCGLWSQEYAAQGELKGVVVISETEQMIKKTERVDECL